MIEDKIKVLLRDLSGYADLVRAMIEKSIKGLLDKEKDEPRANELELEIEERCMTLNAQFEPKAKDLGTILMVVKMNHDLERMADHAVNIAESDLFLIERQPVKPLIDIPRMADITKSMVKGAIDAFVKGDVELARVVILKDDEVDNLKDQIFRELLTYMISDPASIQRALALILVARNLERISDHATNIAEDVIYMIVGKDIRHHIEERKPS